MLRRALTIKTLIVLTFFPCLLLAGKGSDGGGKGVVCRDTQGQIQSVELLDLWEAKTIYNHQIIKSDLPLKPLMKSMASILKNAFQNSLMKASMDGQELSKSQWIENELLAIGSTFFETDTNILLRRNGVILTLTNDSYEVLQPGGNCKIEQIVTYVDANIYGDSRGQAFVNQDLVDKMDTVNIAALYLHEALYKLLRDTYKEPSSIRVRRAIGHVFSGHKFISLDSVLPKKRLACEALRYKNVFSPTKVYFFESDTVWPNNSKSYHVYPEIILGVPVLGHRTGKSSMNSRGLDKIFNNPISDVTHAGLFDLKFPGPIDFSQDYGFITFLDYSDTIKVRYLPRDVLTSGLAPDDPSGQDLKCVLEN